MYHKARFGERKSASESGAAHPTSNPESQWPKLPWGKRVEDAFLTAIGQLYCQFGAISTSFQGVAVVNRVSEMDGMMRMCGKRRSLL
jgi:hypothetical protein